MSKSALHRLTPCPPLGWNSFDSFAGFANEQRLLDNLAVFIDRLAPHGYEYVVVDIGWYKQFDLQGREFPRRGEAYDYCLDAFGRPLPSPCFFPNGFAPIVDACHRAGEGERRIALDPAQCGLVLTARLHDIWNRRDLGPVADLGPIAILPDDVLFLRYS